MIYLHVPFCESRCTYCGFFSIVCASSSAARPTPVSLRSAPYPGKCSPGVVLPQREAIFEAYAEAVCGEIEGRCEEIAKTLAVNTLYIGGGTPSVLPLSVLSKIVRSIDSLPGRGAPAGPWEEFTVEVNPEDIVEKGEEYVRGLLSLGVNRISMGIQSFDDGILRWMNRRHDSATAVEAFHLLRRCGVDNISIDLIFGLPQLSETLWSETLDKALALGPEHISAYQLSIEEDSALERLITRGKFTEATDEQCGRQYDQLCSKLGAAGYRHYEISNFALAGREAVHNSAYWHRVPYVGLGPGAHSLSAGSVRSWNSEDIPHRLGDGSLKAYSREEEHLTPEDIRVERIMLPLRTDNGLPEAELRSLAGDQVVDTLISEGALIRVQDPSVTPFPQDDIEACHPEQSPEFVEGRSEGYIRIPENHFFTSDDIIRQLI
ncbi:MAG: radical SAM family heme chaperone HemW [Bacteroidales bacterium]|nr:radical SAM family heme chaperone HemW [Bacteroidales bacterium]